MYPEILTIIENRIMYNNKIFKKYGPNAFPKLSC